MAICSSASSPLRRSSRRRGRRAVASRGRRCRRPGPGRRSCRAAAWPVCVTWPALHAESTTGDRSRTPTVAARSARFTVVDLQRERSVPPRDRWHGVGAEPIGPARGPPGGNAGRRRVLRSGALRSSPALRLPISRGAADRAGGGRMRDGSALRRRPGGGAGRRGLGLRGPLPRPVAVGHRLPAAARRRRARRPGQRDVPRRLHRAGRVLRRRGRPARLGLHHRPPPAGRRLAAPQPPSAGGRRRRGPGRAPSAATSRTTSSCRRRRRQRPAPVRPAARRPARRAAAAHPGRPDRRAGRRRPWAGRSASVKALQRRGLRALRDRAGERPPEKVAAGAHPYAALAAMTWVR